MLIYNDLDNLPHLTGSIGLSIGFFDGVHRGHQYLFQQMKKHTQKQILLSFHESPYFFTHTKKSFSLITPLQYKLTLLKKYHIDIVVLLHFDQNIQSMSYDKFLAKMQKKTHFTHLFLGENAKLGKDGKGNKQSITCFAKGQNFIFHSLALLQHKNHHITSSYIRQSIQNRQENLFSLLGRPLTYHFDHAYKDNDYLYLSYPHLCLPPDGLYFVLLENKKTQFHKKLQIQQEKGRWKIPLHIFPNKDPTLPLQISLQQDTL